MDTPTREEPAISIPEGPCRIMRGYEAINEKTSTIDFVGCFDGPLLQVRGPRGDPLLMHVDLASKIAEALTLAASVPTAEPGAHDAELIEMGFRPMAHR